MIPIRQLLNRIRWDKRFGQGRFEIGFVDRHQSGLQRVGLSQVVFPKDARGTFEFADETGQWRRVPLHRIRAVYKDGQLIWQRPGNSASSNK